jgi:phage host-nuclease inhibitor protein Gam
MDDKGTQQGTGASGAPGTGGTGANDPREELRSQLEAMGKAAGDLLEQLVKLPATLAQIPMQALPEDAATHARNAASEGFAAVKTLLDSMTKGVDEVIKAQRERMANQGSTHTGVGGTTGTSASASSGAEGDVTGQEAGYTQRLDSGMSDTAGRDINNGGNTVRLDEEP